MVILGIHEGHNASACLIAGGQVVAYVSEERFSRKKNDMGYPRRAVEYCLLAGSVDPKFVDCVAVASLALHANYIRIKRECNFSVDDWVREQHEYWKPRLLEGRPSDEFWQRCLREPRFQWNMPYDFRCLPSDYQVWRDRELVMEIRRRAIQDHLGVDRAKIQFVEHHTCHACYAYYASPLRGPDTVVLTQDGGGDGLNATVSLVREDGLERIAATNESDVGRIYRYITLLLGMKMGDHEYKVMGLAPYATEHEVRKSYEVLGDLCEVDDLTIRYRHRPRDLYFFLKDKFEGHRFDGIAGAVQRFTEEIVRAWVRQVLRKTDATRLVFSGGVSMNIKLNAALAALEEVAEFYVPPSGGDEAVALGAAYAVWEAALRTQGRPADEIAPLTDIYLGPAFSPAEVRRSIAEAGLGERYQIVEGANATLIAQQLIQGRTVARCAGRMEFGARALGNRSILANPADPTIVEKINTQIKYRDFWMPFAPVILRERAADYLVNPKGLLSPYMMLGFETTDKARREIPGALHPADHTARPQILDRAQNPAYWQIVKEFEARTGIGALLNTSLNLHGDPICCTPQDSMHTFENSALDMLLLEDVLVSRVAIFP